MNTRQQSREMRLLNQLDPALAQKWHDRYASRMTQEDRVERNEVETAGLPKSLMTFHDRAALLALCDCSFGYGWSRALAFTRDMLAVSKSERPEMTDNQRRYLWKLVYRFRKQIGVDSELVKMAKEMNGE
jgi:hypothetical protein